MLSLVLSPGGVGDEGVEDVAGVTNAGAVGAAPGIGREEGVLGNGGVEGLLCGGETGASAQQGSHKYAIRTGNLSMPWNLYASPHTKSQT